MFGLAAVAAPAAAQEVNLYTTREPGLIQPLIDAFTKSSGIKVNSIFVKDGLAERVAAEGDAVAGRHPDDGRSRQPARPGREGPRPAGAVRGAREGDSRRTCAARTATGSRCRCGRACSTPPRSLDATTFNYEELADPKWKGKVCIRSGQHPYNTALIAAYLAHHGEAATEAWLKGVKANLARPATGGDRDVARDIMGGICDIGIANSYYVGLMRSGAGGPDQQKWGDAIKVILPTFEGGGTQVNISGAAVAKHAPNKAAAIKFLEYLVSDEAQKIYAEANYEYPVKAGAPVHPLIGALGTLKVDSLPLTEIARQRAAASKLVDKVGLDK